MNKVTLYHRRNCDCCAKACEVLRESGVAPSLIDVERTPHLPPAFTNQTPTVVIDGKIRFRGQVDQRLLRRALHVPLETNRHETTQIGIFAKHWTPGTVKTRLGQSIGMQPASRLAKALIRHSLTRLSDAADRQVVGYWPLDQDVAFAELAHASPASSTKEIRWELAPQSDGDLGQRMHHYFQEAADQGVGRIVLLGTDSPNLPMAHIRQAFDHLRQSPVVLGPTEDGGYYLIGIQGDWVTQGGAAVLFDKMPWSTPQLWEATLQQLASEGLQAGREVAVLPTWYDVDELNDLQRLAADLQTNNAGDAAYQGLQSEIEIALSALL